MITFDEYEINLIKFCANEMGVSFIDLKKAVISYAKKYEAETAEELKAIKNIAELTKADCKRLRREIVLSSIYTNDYENSFGIAPSILYDIMAGYEEEIEYNIYEYGGKWEDYDNAETLYNYIYGVEWDGKYLEEMTAEAKAEILARRDWRSDLFERENIYYIASNLQRNIIKKVA